MVVADVSPRETATRHKARKLPGNAEASPSPGYLFSVWGALPPRLHRSAPRRPDRVFGEGAEHGTRGACAPHAKSRLSETPSKEFLIAGFW